MGRGSACFPGLLPFKAGRSAGDPNSEMRIAYCISHASAGRGWLEKTLWGFRDQEGGWIGAEVANRDGTHDLGPLRVNSWWVPKIAALIGRSEVQVRQWLKNDACFNVEAARWIFLSGLSTARDYWKAIGIYHSPNARRQRQYTDKVVAHLRRRFGQPPGARDRRDLRRNEVRCGCNQPLPFQGTWSSKDPGQHHQPGRCRDRGYACREYDWQRVRGRAGPPDAARSIWSNHRHRPRRLVPGFGSIAMDQRRKPLRFRRSALIEVPS